MATKILFITHDCSPTGAPKVLLHLLNWLKEKSDIELTVLALQGGDLQKDFQRIANHFFLLKKTSNLLLKVTNFFPYPTLKRRIKDFTNNRQFSYFIRQQYDIIYANTIVSIPCGVQLKTLSPNRPKLLVHQHELETLTHMLLSNFKAYSKDIDLIIAVSDLVKNSLINHFQVATEKIRVVYPFSVIPITLFNTLNSNKFIVGGAGTVHWRKGTDLFIQVAHYFVSKYPDIEIVFEWIGSMSKKEATIHQADIRKLNLTNVVQLKGKLSNPIEFYNQLTLFLLPSREDPFPLVGIEVGLLGKPIICFEKASGTAEIIKKGGGFVVPYMDISAMAEKINYYCRHQRQIEIDGAFNQQQFADYTPAQQCPKIYQLLMDYI